MNNLPDTINHPKAFNNSPAAGYDGLFDWSWTQGCFGGGKITPMDFDGVVERKGNFIVFETKDAGVPIPKGQEYTLRSAHGLGVFTVMLVHGKSAPEAVQLWCPPDFRNGQVMKEFISVSVSQARGFVARWYEYADTNPKSKVDVTLLNKRITSISDERDALSNKIVMATSFLDKALEILRD